MTANRRLAASAYPALRRVSCEYCQGTVVLRGEVTSFYLKQLAQATVLAIPLVTAVVNRINVVDACRIVPPG